MNSDQRKRRCPECYDEGVHAGGVPCPLCRSGCVAPSEAGAGGPLNADTGPAPEVGSPHYRELEAILDALLNGIDRCRAELSPGDPVRMHLRDLVDMANAGRNNLHRPLDIA